MKRNQRTILAGLSLAASAIGLFGCGNPGYKVTGDNKKVIAEYAEKRDAAIAYLLKTSVYVGEIRSMETLPTGVALATQSKKMLTLKSEADVFGGVLSPLSHCRDTGLKAQEYWSVVAGGVRTESPDAALAAYVAEAQQCQNQIDSAPVALVYVETQVGGAPPLDNCLEVVSLDSSEKVQSWSCPAGSMPKS